MNSTNNSIEIEIDENNEKNLKSKINLILNFRNNFSTIII